MNRNHFSKRHSKRSQRSLAKFRKIENAFSNDCGSRCLTMRIVRTIQTTTDSIRLTIHLTATRLRPTTRFLRTGNMLCRHRHGWQMHRSRYFVARTFAGLQRLRHERLPRDTRRHGARFRRHPDGHHQRYFELQRYYCAVHRDRRHDEQRHRVVGRVLDCLRRLHGHQHRLLLVRYIANPELGSFAGQKAVHRLRLRQQPPERQLKEGGLPAAGHEERFAPERQLEASRSECRAATGKALI